MTMLPGGLPRLTVRQASRLLDSGAVTSEQLCSYCYTLAQAGDDVWGLGAFAALAPREEVLEHARRSDDRRRRARPLSVLDGVPVSVKANIAVASLPLTAGSRVLGAHCPAAMPCAGYNADVTESLLVDGGAVLVGSTTMDEFGMGSLGQPARNPRLHLARLGQRTMNDKEVVDIVNLEPEVILEAHHAAIYDGPVYSAGGSSCGSAVSVAHGSSLASLGTDTGGSVRLPAAWCGVVGLKPTYGLLSRHGLVSYASSLDCPGILAPSADCVALLLRHLVQQRSDHDSNIIQPHDRLEVLGHILTETAVDDERRIYPLKGIKVGIPAAFSIVDCPSAVLDAWNETIRKLEDLGAGIETISVDEISVDVVQRSLSAYYVLASAEASSNLARYDGIRYGIAAELAQTMAHDHVERELSILERQYMATRSMGFGHEVVRRIFSGTAVLSSDRFHTYYEAAAQLRSRLTRELRTALRSHDLLLLPTAVFAPAIKTDKADPTEALANDIMTVPASLAGLPAISICPRGTPSPSTEDFPPGMQLIAARLGEATILRAAIALENVSRN